ncbi:MAG: GPW/gp25 family protein [Candidatus Zixiibacteriota bacterium]|nr:MAG: GPW/gp25 family protein [candidate division Zixibacteria bacterium]
MDYLALPFVLRDGYLDKASLQESITHSVGLLLSARRGLMKFWPEYGSDIWDKEFSDLYATNRADLLASLRNTIGKHESRLLNVAVSFVDVEGNVPHALGLAVRVSGNYEEDGEDKKFEADYVLG